MQAPTPQELANTFVTLKPLRLDEAAAYAAIGNHPDIWQYLSAQPFTSSGDAEYWIRDRLRRSEKTGEIHFSVYDNHSGHLAGSTAYLDIRQSHGGLEIGYTWYGKAFQRTYVNTATKLALLEHAFVTLDVNRVQLQTDSRNLKSQQAIERLGATREGLLRQHKIYPDGYVRDSVIYSITRYDWPQVEQVLLRSLNR
ncbi:MAG: GNAT family protein [Pseudomonadota bacterium]